MNKWPRDNQADLIAFYGDPKRDVPAQLVKVIPPFQMYYTDKTTTKIPHIWFHRKVAPSLLAAMNEIWDFYKHDQAAIDKAGVSDFGGSYNPRYIRGSTTKWSNHAYGAAIDLDAKNNGLYQKGDMPLEVVNAFKRQGFRWGGDYTSRKDPMHFEACTSNEAVAKVYGFGPSDNGFDDSANDEIIEANDNIKDANYSIRDDDSRPTPWYMKVWTWVSGGGIGALGVGGSLFSGIDPVTIGIILGFAFLVFLVVWFTRK